MARADSYNKSASKNVIKEHFRELKNYKNSVDLTKSNNNLIYGDYDNANDFLLAAQRRVNTIMNGRDVQKQTNILSEWVISKPKNFKGTDKEFFDKSYEFTQKRYGAENVIGAFVHNDETNPHIHIMLVPECISRKTGNKTVSSASLLTRKELSEYQQELDNACFKAFGEHKLILNGETKQNGMKLDEFKRVTAEEQQAQADRIAKLEKRLGYLQGFVREKGLTEDYDSWLRTKRSKKPVKAPVKPQEASKRDLPELDSPQPVKAPVKPQESFKRQTLSDYDEQTRKMSERINADLGEFEFAQPDTSPLDFNK